MLLFLFSLDVSLNYKEGHLFSLLEIYSMWGIQPVREGRPLKVVSICLECYISLWLTEMAGFFEARAILWYYFVFPSFSCAIARLYAHCQGCNSAMNDFINCTEC